MLDAPRRGQMSVYCTLRIKMARLSLALECMASLFWDYAKAGRAPESWGEAGRQLEEDFHHAMGSRFPQFLLCSGMWKSQALATAKYPSWYLYNIRRKREQGAEPEAIIKRAKSERKHN